MRAQVVQVDQQLRMVSSPTYSPLDRDKALAEQNVSGFYFIFKFYTYGKAFFSLHPLTLKNYPQGRNSAFIPFTFSVQFTLTLNSYSPLSVPHKHIEMT